MDSFQTHRGLVATLDRAHIDTDQIIPKQFLKSTQRTGFGENLFFDWRYTAEGKPNASFVLNQPRFRGASILVTRNNFGCGSSREHAVWAMVQYGFRAVIAPWKEQGGVRAPAFADIFRNNAGKNSLLTIELADAEVDQIFKWADRVEGLEASIDLDEQRVVLHLGEEVSFHFEIDAAVKKRLIHGLDDIALTLKAEDQIGAFERRHHPQG